MTRSLGRGVREAVTGRDDQGRFGPQFETLEPRLHLDAEGGLVVGADPSMTPMLSLSETQICVDESVTLTGTFDEDAMLYGRSLVIDWGDGAAMFASARDFSFSHVYAGQAEGMLMGDGEGPAVYTISVDVIGVDEDLATIDLIVVTAEDENSAPVITEFATSAAGIGDGTEGQAVTVSGAFTDADLMDTHAATIDWGDGTTSEAVIATVGGVGTIAGEHVYEAGGIYSVSVTLSDEADGVAAAAAAAVISGAGIHDGVLMIIGTDGGDRVKLCQQEELGIKLHARLSDGRRIQRDFDAAGIEKIMILLGDGNDRARLSGSVDVITMIAGGAGNDHIKVGGGPAVLLGGAGADRLIGGSANDILIGGLGADRIVGGPGDDILIGGSTAFDVDDEAIGAGLDAALMAMLAEWNTDADCATRLANLDGTGGGAGLNGTDYLQLGETVFADADGDNWLAGCSGENWCVDGSDARVLRRLQKQQEREALRQAARQQRQQEREAREAAREAARQQRQQEREARQAAREAAREQRQQERAEARAAHQAGKK